MACDQTHGSLSLIYFSLCCFQSECLISLYLFTLELLVSSLLWKNDVNSREEVKKINKIDGRFVWVCPALIETHFLSILSCTFATLTQWNILILLIKLIFFLISCKPLLLLHSSSIILNGFSDVFFFFFTLTCPACNCFPCSLHSDFELPLCRVVLCSPVS